MLFFCTELNDSQTFVGLFLVNCIFKAPGIQFWMTKMHLNYLKVQNFGCHFFSLLSFGRFVKEWNNRPAAFFCCPWSLGSLHSAYFISKCHRGFEDSPLWKMEQHKLLRHHTLCYQEIRKWRWSTLEETLVLLASVPELRHWERTEQTSHSRGSDTVVTIPR